ncbi:MAG: hypothetical protein GX148_05115 [Clostridiales bacterium]|jgi:lysophospholipase L1-like esterase|nr:hypothetical protein [Clostridiales bacterium]
MKRLIVFSLLLSLLLVSCVSPGQEQSKANERSVDETTAEETSEDTASDTTDESEAETDADIIYYAFGDSIAFGYGLANPETMCYGALFTDRFEDIYYVNHAVSGDKTSDMLNVLENVDVSKADLISVSIGANNLLGYAIEELLIIFAKYGTNIMVEYIGVLTGNPVTDRVINCLKDIEKAFTDEDFLQKAENGLDKLKAELPQIFEKLKSQNPGCVIIIQTIYNPYKGITLAIPGEYSFDLSEVCDGYISGYNTAITEIAGEYGVHVLDVYTDFENATEDYINAGLSLDIPVYFNADPHPNAKGHERIAEILYEEWEKISTENE